MPFFLRVFFSSPQSYSSMGGEDVWYMGGGGHDFFIMCNAAFHFQFVMFVEDCGMVIKSEPAV